jgi:hypothetical protein
MWDVNVETELSSKLRRGAAGPEVKRVQEWLTLSGFAVQPDGKFGPATELAVRRYQRAKRLPDDGVVTPDCYALLVAPLAECLTPLEAQGDDLPALTLRYAERHHRLSPREVGGQNRGPWVRLYMNGREGRQWLWCAGFVCFCLRQACLTLGVELPFAPSFSCDLLAANAKQRGRFVEGRDASARAHLRPGDLFLIRRDSDDWNHVGIVRELHDESFDTIEGNTNDEGSTNGGEVAARTRSFDGRDFLAVGGRVAIPVG